MMSSGLRGESLQYTVKLFSLISFTCHLNNTAAVCGAPQTHYSNFGKFAAGAIKPDVEETYVSPSGTFAPRLKPADSFQETKPDFISPQQWATWKKRYGFAPLGEFCDSCRQTQGKCRYVQACQDYCAEDCYGHGKDFNGHILCSWCNGARDERCKSWRSCRDHCGVLCLHERYNLKIQADLQREMEEQRKRRKQLYEDYREKKDAKYLVWAEKEKDKKRAKLEEARKRLAQLAGLEYRPRYEEL